MAPPPKEDPDPSSSSPRSIGEQIIGLVMRIAVLGVALYIAVRATSKPHADYGAIFLSLTFVLTALGYSAQGIAKILGRD